MQKIILLISLLFFLLPIVNGQEEKLALKQDYPNLWIVVVDESGSMMSPGSSGWNIGFKRRLSDTIISQFVRGFPSTESQNTVQFDFDRDYFLFLSSGMVRKEHINDPDKNFVAGSQCCDSSVLVCLDWIESSSRNLAEYQYLESQYIRSTPSSGDSSFIKFKGEKDGIAYLRKQVERLDYSYQYSFVTLIKLYALQHLLAFHRDYQDLSKFNQLFFLVVSDDKDQNDRMGTDQKSFRDCAPKQYSRTLELFDLYETNTFNSNSRRLGAFKEIYSTRTPGGKRPWNLHLYEYATVKDSLLKGTLNDVLEVSFTSDSTLRIDKKSDWYNTDSLLFVQLDTIMLDGSDLTKTNIQINNAQEFELKIEKESDSLELYLSGYMHLRYQDEILGPRVRTLKIGGMQGILDVRSPLAPRLRAWWEFPLMVLAVISAILGLAILIFHRIPLFNLTDGFGNHYTVYWRTVFLLSKRDLHLAHFGMQHNNQFIAPENFIKKQELNAPQGETGAIYLQSNRDLYFDADQLEIVDRFPAGTDPIQFPLEEDDDYLQSFDIIKPGINKIRFVQHGLEEIRFKIIQNLGPTFVITFEGLKNHQTNIPVYLVETLSAHVANGEKARNVLVIKDGSNDFQWSLVQLEDVKGRINKAKWLIDYRQPKASVEGKKMPVEIALSKMATKLVGQLGIHNDTSFYVSDMPAFGAFKIVETNTPNYDFQWKISPFRAFIQLLVFVNNISKEWTTEEDVIADHPGNLCLYNPLTATRTKEEPILGLVEGEFKLYESLFPDFRAGLEHAGGMKILSHIPLRSYSSEVSFLSLENNKENTDLAITFLNETIEI